MADPTKPNNKIANPYASYITDTLVGYFIGEPVSYGCENDTILENIQEIMDYNDEADENVELAKNCSIYGVGYEMLYVDEDKNIRFKSLDPKECIPIYDNSIEHNLLAFIRVIRRTNLENDTDYLIIEVIDDKEIKTFETSTSIGNFIQKDTPQTHLFGMVPIAIFKNNEEQTGDYEKVMSLIDAYDKMESDSLNDFEYFTDAYLALYGFTADNEDILGMKQNRVLLMDEGTSAEWLTKNVSDSHIENIKNRIDKDIHKFAKCPNMSDENFASNASGVAIKYKLLGTENVVAIKERKFKKGLQQRLELINQFTSLLDGEFDWRDINIYFTRNIPSNDADIANIVNTLKNIVSTETLLGQIPFVEDIQQEMDRLDKEKEVNPFYQAYEEQFGNNKMNNEDAENEEEEEQV